MKRPGARAVQERRCGGAVRRDPGDAAVVVLDEVRVEARRRRHDEHLPAPRIERDDGAALRPELLLRDLLGAEIEVRDDVVPADRLALELVQGPVDDGREVRVRGRQVVVQRALEAGARAPDGRVADDVRGERAVAGSAGSRASCRRPPGRGCRASRLRGWSEKMRPRSIENSATRRIALSCRAASPAEAHVCQYVVITTSAPTRSRAT